MKQFLLGCLIGFLAFTLGAQSKQPTIEDLQTQLEMCREHNAFLDEEKAEYLKTHAQIREYWRIKCGCFTVDEVVAAMTEYSDLIRKGG